ncbi:MAG: 2-phosphosulfolactate phosphatase [Bacteroidota bacterium]
MQLDVVLSPSALDPDAVKDHRVVMVDVLRASTTIATAIANGARGIIPATDTGEAGRLAATLDADASLLGGERDGKRVDGFGAGNSPAEYGPEAVDGKTVVLTTTNGTRALAKAKAGRSVAIGGFVNSQRAADFLAEGLAAGTPGLILCAGWYGRVSLEDALCAGLLVHLATPPEKAGALSDPAKIAYALYQGSRDDIERAIRGTEHGRRLQGLGSGDDIARCAALDELDVLPVLNDGRITAG